MKTSRLLLALSLLSSVLCTAAPAAVEILSATQVKVDGSPAGDVVQALRAFPDRAPEILNAIDAKLQAAAAANAQLQAQRQQETAALQQQLDAAAAERQAKVAELTAAKVKLEADNADAADRVTQLVAALDFVSATALPAKIKAALQDARQSKADKLRADLTAQKAALEAQLAALPASK